jgi:ketosteroid isomerase-like protein
MKIGFERMKEAGMADESSVREANERFYMAMTTGEIDEMDAMWVHDAQSVCIHPGRDAIVGYDQIRESWSMIFSSENSMSIAASNERITVSGDTAWVVCNETISVATPEGLGAAAAQATNIFRRISGKWKMVLHHASGVPFTTQDDWPDLIN